MTDRPFPPQLLHIAPKSRWTTWSKGIGDAYQHGPWQVHVGYNGIAVVEYSKGATQVRVRCYGLGVALNACNGSLRLLRGT